MATTVTADHLHRLQAQVDQMRERLDFIGPMLPLVTVARDYFQKVDSEAAVQLMRLRGAQIGVGSTGGSEGGASSQSALDSRLETARWLQIVTEAVIEMHSRQRQAPEQGAALSQQACASSYAPLLATAAPVSSAMAFGGSSVPNTSRVDGGQRSRGASPRTLPIFEELGPPIHQSYCLPHGHGVNIGFIFAACVNRDPIFSFSGLQHGRGRGAGLRCASLTQFHLRLVFIGSWCCSRRGWRRSSTSSWSPPGAADPEEANAVLRGRVADSAIRTACRSKSPQVPASPWQEPWQYARPGTSPVILPSTASYSALGQSPRFTSRAESAFQGAQGSASRSTSRPRTGAPDAGAFPSSTETSSDADGLSADIRLGKGSWATAYKLSQGRRREALQLLCNSGIVTARELSDDLTVVSTEHIDECVHIALEMLQIQSLDVWVRRSPEARQCFEERLTALYQRMPAAMSAKA